MKQAYLAVHGYGMGGIWMFIDASSPEEVQRAYPELQVFASPPAFLTPKQLGEIETEWHFDVDDAPTGYLADLVAGRDRT